MSKRLATLNGNDFMRMVNAGAARLRVRAEQVNALNVFPVPDGDTGTNMNMTMTAGAEEMNRRPSDRIGKAAEALAKGLLMGARGNSGVILSQLFRGFSKSVQDLDAITPVQLAAALEQGVKTAYQAVVKPVEGTILTVAKEAAKHATYMSRRTGDVEELMREIVKAGDEALAKTPDFLPVLKQVGVVDSGGQGLMHIYEGFLAVLSGETIAADSEPAAKPAVAETAVMPGHQSAQAHMATEDIEFGYCTEFLVKLVPGKTKGEPFQESAFRRRLTKFGDSLLVVADDDLVKIHIHAEYPGEVMNYAMKFGDLTRIKIDNMREQHSHILASDAHIAAEAAEAEAEVARSAQPLAKYGFVAVAMGEGVAAIFESLGVDVVISGGQTMNPSTEDILDAVSRVPAEVVFVLPNNSNIVLAAQQARDIAEDKRIVVIPAKTIPQGMAAMVAFAEKADVPANEQAMQAAIGRIESGQITYAVRDTELDGIAIRQGDFIGLHNNQIVTSNAGLPDTCRALLDRMLAGGGDIVTVLTGEDALPEQTDAIVAYVKDAHPDAEIEVHEGGQPLYTYIFSVE